MRHIHPTHRGQRPKSRERQQPEERLLTPSGQAKLFAALIQRLITVILIGRDSEEIGEIKPVPNSTQKRKVSFAYDKTSHEIIVDMVEGTFLWTVTTSSASTVHEFSVTEMRNLLHAVGLYCGKTTTEIEIALDSLTPIN